MTFSIFSVLHISILVATFLLAFAFSYYARKSSNESAKKMTGRIFAVILLLNYIAYFAHRVHSGYWELRYDLPMELCNWAVFTTIIALFTGKIIFAEISYFWVMTGSLNALLTPAMNETFPHPYFFFFFIEHSGVVIACIYVVAGLRMYPRKWSVLRVFGISQIYFASALVLDFLLNANYGFLMNKPATGSLLDIMGPWPWYLASLQLAALVLYSLLYIPFYFVNRKS